MRNPILLALILFGFTSTAIAFLCEVLGDGLDRTTHITITYRFQNIQIREPRLINRIVSRARIARSQEGIHTYDPEVKVEFHRSRRLLAKWGFVGKAFLKTSDQKLIWLENEDFYWEI